MAETQEKRKERSQYLKEVDAAEFLNLSVFTLRNWRHAGVGPRIRKFQRAVRYAMSDLVEYADSRKR